jgi:hypothetical protein
MSTPIYSILAEKSQHKASFADKHTSGAARRSFHESVRKILLITAALFALIGTHRAHGGGLTLVTHGNQWFINDPGENPETTSWLDAMTNYIQDKTQGTGAVYELLLQRIGGGAVTAQLVHRSGPKLDSGGNTSGEVIVKVNWVAAAGLPGSLLNSQAARTGQIAEAVADTLLNWPDGRNPLTGPIHLIGHSRGGSVMCEVSKLLGESGVWVDHLTTLDPHPVESLGDAPARLWESVSFADNYHQSSMHPRGQIMSGAYNRSDLALAIMFGGYGGFVRLHSNVHFWYHGTLNTDTNASNGEVTFTGTQMRSAWYAPSEALGTRTGYWLSRLGGGTVNRNVGEFATGRVNFGPSKQPLNRAKLLRDLSGNTWPSIIDVQRRSVNKSSTGIETFKSWIRYQDFDSTATITVKLDYDRNPTPSPGDILFASNQFKTRASHTVAATGWNTETREIEWNTSGVPSGTYWVNTEISDGVRTRSFYDLQSITVTNTGTPPGTGGGTNPVVTVPTPPSELSAVATSSSSISLAWQDRSNNEGGFRIERRTGTSGSWSAIVTNKSANSTTHTDSGLSAGTTYSYRAAAFNSAGGSNSFSNEATASTPATQGTQFTLTINSTNPGSGVSVYTSLSDWTNGTSGVTPALRTFASGTTVNVSCALTAPGGQVFQKWQMNGADYAFSTATTVTMSAARTLTAVYGFSAPPTRTLSSLSIAGPNTVNEGSAGQFTATAHFSDGAQQVITPSPWGTNFGAPGTISSAGVFTAGAVTSDTIVTINASFTSGGVPRYATKDIVVRRVASQQTFTLTTNAVHGSITRSPNLPSYSAGSVVVVSVTAHPGYFFANWTGASTSTASSITVVMDSNKTLTAQFGTGSAPGNLVVNISPPEVVSAGAQWRFNEWEPWRNSGTPATPTHNGEYFIQLKEIPGWTRPFPGRVTVSTGTTATLNVSYIQQPGSLQVVLQPADAVTAGAQWRVDGGAWQNSGASQNVLPENRTIEFKSAGSWTTPPPQTITITHNQSAVVHGNYAPPLGQPVIASISPPNGPLEGGTAVTIEGVNFGPGAVVRFGGVNATTVIVNSSSSITAFTPPNNAYVTVPVSVTVGAQTASNPNGFSYAVPRGEGIELIGQLGGLNQCVEVRGNYAYLGEGSSLVVLDISNLAQPTPVGRINCPGMVNGIALNGNFAYVAADDAGLQAIDISIPTAPAIRSYFHTGGVANKVIISNNRAFVADGNKGLQIIDISNPQALTRIGSFDTPNNALDVTLLTGQSGTFAAVADGGDIRIINVTNIANPTLTVFIGVGGWVDTVASSGDHIFTVNTDNFTLISINASNREQPSISATLQATGLRESLKISGNNLLGVGSSGLRFVDISSPGNPTNRGGKNIPQAKSLAISNGNAFVTSGGSFSGLTIINTNDFVWLPVIGTYQNVFGRTDDLFISGQNLRVSNYFGAVESFNVGNPLSIQRNGGYSFNGGNAASIAGDGNTVCVLTGNGVQILDWSNPNSVQVRSVIPQNTFYVSSLAFQNNRLFVGGSAIPQAGPRFGIFNISNLGSPVQNSNVSLPHSGIYYLLQGIGVAGDRAFQAMRDEGLAIWNVSNPAQPARHTTLAIPQNPTFVSPSANGDYAYVSTLSGMTVVDCRNPSNPSIVSTVDVAYWSPKCRVFGNFAYLVSSIKGLHVIDITRPNEPIIIAKYDTPSWAFDVAVRDDTVFVADAHGGVQVLRMQDTAVPTLVVNHPGFDLSQPSPSDSITLTGTATDNKSVAKVFWTNNRGGSGEASGTSTWSAGPMQLYPGQNIITVIAMDGAGNRGSASVTILHSPPDQVAPIVRSVTPQSGARMTVNTQTFTLMGTANDNVALTEVTWTSDRGFSGTATGTALWSIPDAPLLEGDNVFTVTARDLAGNTSTDTATVIMVPPDLEAPSVAIQFPTLDPMFETPTSPLSLAGMAGDNTGVGSVRWANHRGGQGGASGRESWAISSVPLKAGLNVITVTCTDLAGNATSTALTVMHSPNRIPNRPVAIIRKPGSGARIENESALIEGTASAKEGVNVVFYQVNDQPWQVAAGGIAWSFTANLAPGPNAVRVKTLDAVGVESLVVTRLLTRVVRSGMVVATVGEGSVVPSGFRLEQELELGRNYTMTARPAKGWMFAGWSGGLVSMAPKMVFTMKAGLETTATFIENPFKDIGGSYLGLAQAEADAHETKGLLRATVSTAGSFSGSLLLGGQSHRLSGKFDSNGYWTGQIRRSRQAPLAALLMLDPSSESLSGIVAGQDFYSAILADRAVYHARDNPAPQIGAFTFAMEPDAEALLAPVGYGAGTLAVDGAGRTRISGRLADGTPLTFSGHVSRNGTWPLYVTLYGKSGSIAGSGLFADLQDSDTSGRLFWFKPSNLRDARFKDGFTSRPTLFAQRYIRPSSLPSRLLPQWDETNGAGTLRLTGPDLLTELIQPVTWQVGNLLSTDESVIEGVRWSPTANTGLFSGSFIDPQTLRRFPMNGALLQKTGEGLGWLQAPNSTGAVLLEPVP